MQRNHTHTQTHTHISAKRQHQAVKLPIKCLPEKSLEVNEVVLVGGSAVTANEPNHPPSSRSSTSHQRSTLSKCKLAISSVVGVVAVADAVWGAHWQRFDNTTCGLVRVFHTTDELKSLAVLSQCFPLRRHDEDRRVRELQSRQNPKEAGAHFQCFFAGGASLSPPPECLSTAATVPSTVPSTTSHRSLSLTVSAFAATVAQGPPQTVSHGLAPRRGSNCGAPSGRGAK